MRFVLSVVFSWSVVAISAAGPYPYELVDLGAGAGLDSFASAMNERDEVTGVVRGSAEGDEVNQVFFWNGRFNHLPKFGERAFAQDMNIHGAIVGVGFTNGAWRPWVYRAGTYELLPGVSAEAINDEGHIAGRIAGAVTSDAYLISEDPPRWLMGPRDDTNSSCWGNVVDLNEAGMALGSYCNASAILSNYLASPSMYPLNPRLHEKVWHTSQPYALNEKGQVAGAFKMHYYPAQAGLWSDNDWHELGTLLQQPSAARDINDAGLLVGTVPGAAVLWLGNRVGYDLNTLVKLPAGWRIINAVGINNRNSIAVTVDTGEGWKAALLRTNAGSLNLPTYEVNAPATTLVTGSNLTVSVRMSDPENHPGREITKVVYTLFWRTMSGGGTEPLYYSSWTDRTNVVTTAPFAVEYGAVEPRHYVVTAEVHDSRGLRAVTVPRRFVFVGNNEIRGNLQASAPRVNETFRFTLGGRPDYRYRVEHSENLVDWFPLFDEREIGTLIDSYRSNRFNFYRAVTVGTEF